MNILSIYLNMNILRKTNIDAEKKKAEGNTFYTNKQYKEAIECYTEAIGKDEFKKKNNIYFIYEMNDLLVLTQFGCTMHIQFVRMWKCLH